MYQTDLTKTQWKYIQKGLDIKMRKSDKVEILSKIHIPVICTQCFRSGY